MITSEVIFNKAVLETILELASHDHMEDAATKTVSALRTKFGDKVLDRLAQLLPNEDLAKLNNYYLDIRLFRQFFTPSADAATLSPETKHAVEKLMAATHAVISVAKNH